MKRKRKFQHNGIIFVKAEQAYFKKSEIEQIKKYNWRAFLKPAKRLKSKEVGDWSKACANCGAAKLKRERLSSNV